jgi:hypothetical protein
VLSETHKYLAYLELASSSPQHRGLYHHEQASQTRPSHGVLERAVHSLWWTGGHL